MVWADVHLLCIVNDHTHKPYASDGTFEVKQEP
jgi:hypothetical protein